MACAREFIFSITVSTRFMEESSRKYSMSYGLLAFVREILMTFVENDKKKIP